MGNVVGNALVPGAEQVDRAGLAHQHAGRTERPGPGDPQLRRAGDVADVGLATEDQNVEIVRRHLLQRPPAAPRPQRAAVGQDFSCHTGSYG